MLSSMLLTYILQIRTMVFVSGAVATADRNQDILGSDGGDREGIACMVGWVGG